MHATSGLRRSLSVVVLAGSSYVGTILAQPGFERVYGGPGMEFGYSVRQCADGGCVLVGSTESFGTGDRDIYLVRTDANGDTLWTRTYGGAGFDSGWEVEPTADGGFIFCALQDLHALVVKVDESGQLEWATELPDIAWAIEQTTDGDYMIAGSMSMGNHSDMRVTRLTTAGQPAWTKTYGTVLGNVELNDQALDIRPTSDGAFVVYGCGGASPLLGTYNDHYLVKIDAAGDTLWTRRYGNEDNQAGWSAEGTSDGGLILLGTTMVAGESCYEVLKTDAIGTLQWSTTLPGEGGADEGYEIHQTPDGGYAFSGRIVDGITESSSVYLVKLDAQGDTTWTRTFRQGQGPGLELTNDGGFAIAGFTVSIGAGLYDMYLIKTDANGIITGQAEPVAQQVHPAFVFPDPVIDQACIQFPNPQRTQVTFHLLNGLGQTVRQQRCGSTDRVTFRRDDLPAGPYQFVIGGGKGRLAQGRLVVE